MHQEKTKINILFIAAEAEPFVKVGGLGDVAGILPKALLKASKTHPDAPKIDLRLVIPYHAIIKKKDFQPEKIGTFPLKALSGTQTCEVYYLVHEGLPVYLLDSPIINTNAPVYYGDPQLDGQKYAFFSIACLELIKFLNWQVDILHANDWHTAVSIYALKTTYHHQKLFKSIKTILTLHNLPYNGYGAQPALLDLGVLPLKDPNLPEWAQHTPLPLGLATADKIVAVSPNYAQEILTPAYGCGLDLYLTTKQENLTGILNGIDTDIWNPQTDPNIPSNFTIETLDNKAFNKTAIQAEFGLPQSETTPLLTIVSRMDFQKGIDIALRGLQLELDKPWQAIILGTGDPSIEAMANQMAAAFTDKIKVITQFNQTLAHKLYAAADIFLMPSRYEPCGLSQMIAMRYGTIPIAHTTGGLKDTISHYNRNPEQATGFLFYSTYPSAFRRALRRALITFQNKAIWRKLQKNGMQKDFTWEKSALSYLGLYRQLLLQ